MVSASHTIEDARIGQQRSWSQDRKTDVRGLSGCRLCLEPDRPGGTLAGRMTAARRADSGSEDSHAGPARPAFLGYGTTGRDAHFRYRTR